MRLACGASSLLSWRSASADSSTFQAMTLHHVFQGDGLFFAVADPLESALREIKILQISKVLKDGFPDIVGLGTPGAAGQLFKAFFDGWWKPYGQHSNSARQV